MSFPELVKPLQTLSDVDAYLDALVASGWAYSPDENAHDVIFPSPQPSWSEQVALNQRMEEVCAFAPCQYTAMAQAHIRYHGARSVFSGSDFDTQEDTR